MKVYIVRTEVFYSVGFLETKPEDLGVFLSKANAKKFARRYNAAGFGGKADIYEYDSDPTYEEWFKTI